MNRLLEICIDSIESGIISERAGADRVELCDNLFEGGTTPGPGTLKIARKELKLGLNIMIRPRGGDFLYSDIEYDIIKEDIRIAKEEGADGLVFGILTPDGGIDISRTKELVELSSPLPVTFHRAFDMSVDPFKSLEDIISCGVKRILTAGHKNLAIHGIDLIRNLIEKAGNRIIIMPGSGINENNIAGIINETGAKELHLTGRKTITSKMRYKKEDIFMGGLPEIPEFTRKISDENRIKKAREIIDSFN
jgi:copper homeostasis protein